MSARLHPPSSNVRSSPRTTSPTHRSRVRLLAFERGHEQTAAPSEWKFTRSDLAKLMQRLADKPDYRSAA